ncbi:hypothetical protein RUND412_001616 [Rhizina undulata]
MPPRPSSSDLNNPDNVELLIHTSAPTSRKNDDIYRAQALAFLAFEPGRKVELGEVWVGRKRRKGQEIEPDEEESAGEKKRRVKGKGMEREAMQTEMHNPSERVSQRSGKTTRKSKPGMGMGKAESEPPKDPPLITSTAIERDANIPYSVPAPEIQVLRTPAIQVLRTPAPSQPIRNLSPTSSRLPPTIGTTQIDDSFGSWDPPPDSIADSQATYQNPHPTPTIPIPDPPPESGKARPDEPIAPISFGPRSFTLPTLAPLPSDLPEYASVDSPESSIASLHSTLDSPPLPPFDFNPQLIPPPHTITAPPPAASSNPPILTHALEEIMIKLRSRYVKLKKYQTRPIRERERGCWNIEMDAMGSGHEQITFWNRLVESVGAGTLGFVNVFLEMHGNRKEKMVVKVYCWGGAVEHIWGALYVMATKKMAGARWVDAGGTAVVGF